MLTKEILVIGKRLLFITLIPLFSWALFLLFALITGYSGRNSHHTPSIIETFNLSYGVAIIIRLGFILCLFAFYKLWSKLTADNAKYLILQGNYLIIKGTDDEQIFPLQKCEKVSFNFTTCWKKLYFNRYYKVAVVKFKYNAKRHAYYFPIRDMDDESELLKFKEKFEKKKVKRK